MQATWLGTAQGYEAQVAYSAALRDGPVGPSVALGRYLLQCVLIYHVLIVTVALAHHFDLLSLYSPNQYLPLSIDLLYPLAHSFKYLPSDILSTWILDRLNRIHHPGRILGLTRTRAWISTQHTSSHKNHKPAMLSSISTHSCQYRGKN